MDWDSCPQGLWPIDESPKRRRKDQGQEVKLTPGILPLLEVAEEQMRPKETSLIDGKTWAAFFKPVLQARDARSFYNSSTCLDSFIRYQASAGEAPLLRCGSQAVGVPRSPGFLTFQSLSFLICRMGRTLTLEACCGLLSQSGRVMPGMRNHCHSLSPPPLFLTQSLNSQIQSASLSFPVYRVETCAGAASDTKRP